MSFKPTGIFEWILVGYGGVVALVTLVVTPLVIGLGEDTGRGSPLAGVSFKGSGAWSGGTWGGQGAWGGRWKRRGGGARIASSGGTVAADPCRTAIDRLIRCADNANVKSVLKDRKEKFIRECKAREPDVRKAERCAKQTSCKTFQRCLLGT